MIERRLADVGGFARTREIARTSRDRVRLARAISDGTVLRVARGIVALPPARDLAAAMAAGGSVTCVSAFGRYGLPLLTRPTSLHVAVSRERGPTPRLVTHWDRAAAHGGYASRPRVLVHASRCLPRAEWIAAADAAVRAGLDPADLLACHPARGRRAFADLLGAIDPRSESLPESLLRVAMRDAGLAVETQVVVPGVGRVDFLVGAVVVEVDGFAYHGDRAQYREDRRRDRAANLAGLRVLRCTFEDVVNDRARVVAEISQLVDASSPEPIPDSWWWGSTA